MLDFDIEISRKDVRTLRLSVKRDGRVTLSVPRFVSEARVQAFLAEHEQWILTQRKRLMTLNDLRTLHYVTGEKHALWGTYYRLEVRTASVREYATLEPMSQNGSSPLESASREGRATIEPVPHGEKVLVVYAAAGASEADRRRILYRYYHEQLQPILRDMLSKWYALLGHADAHITLRYMRTEWGSCTAGKNRMTFNVDLARVPLECVEYVVVHELTHFDYQNHSHAFWLLLDERLCKHGLLLSLDAPGHVPDEQHAVRLRKRINTYVTACNS